MVRNRQAARHDQPGRGLFLNSGGTTKLIARSGDPIKGTTYNFTDFNVPVVNSNGDIAFGGYFGGRSRGIFLKTAKGIEKVVATEDPVPGGGKEEVFSAIAPPLLNDRGEIVFLAQSKSPNFQVNIGVYLRDQKGVLRAIAKRGDKMPGNQADTLK